MNRQLETIEQKRNKAFAEVKKASVSSGKQAHAVSEEMINNKCHTGDLINLDIQNTTGGTLTIIIGSSLGLATAPHEQQTAYDSIAEAKRPYVRLDSISEEGENIVSFPVLDAAGDPVDPVEIVQLDLTKFGARNAYQFKEGLVDQYGARAPFLEAINKRFMNQNALVHSIQAIAQDENQRKIAPKLVNIPVNLEDASFKRMASQAVFTELNEAELLKGKVSLNQNNGLAYDILPGVSVSLNINIAALETMTFKV